MLIFYFVCCPRSSDFNDFLSKCLVKDPSERQAAADLLEHSFITQVSDNKPLRILYQEIKSEVQEIVEELSEDADLLHDPEHTEETVSENQSIHETTFVPLVANGPTGEGLDLVLKVVL